jgi:Tfp pilus assembly protein PilP
MKKLSVILLTLLSACGELSEKKLAQWVRASDSQKDKVLSDLTPESAKYVKKCMNRLASLPNTEKVKIVDAKENCLTGLRLKEQNAKKTNPLPRN